MSALLLRCLSDVVGLDDGLQEAEAVPRKKEDNARPPSPPLQQVLPPHHGMQ